MHKQLTHTVRNSRNPFICTSNSNVLILDSRVAHADREACSGERRKERLHRPERRDLTSASTTVIKKSNLFRRNHLSVNKRTRGSLKDMRPCV